MIEGELVEETAIALTAPATLYGTHDPSEIAQRAGKQSRILADVIRKNGLAKRIGGRGG